MSHANRSPDPSRRIGELLIPESLFTSLLNEIHSAVSSAIATEFEKLKDAANATAAKATAADAQPPSAAVTTGVEITPVDKIKAAELRTALLLGKLSDEPGILIDVKVTARLLNISPRMVSRLNDLQTMPEPVRLGSLVRWRLAEIIEWVDSDCPPRKLWNYSGHRGSSKRKSR